jgi:hypothetical protein
MRRGIPMKRKKPLRVPVTQGLKDIYGMDMHLAYHAAIVGQFNVVAFSRLAVAIAVIRSALEQKCSQIPQAIETLDAAIEILAKVRKKGDDTDIWELTEAERPAVLEGINMAEQCIGTLDVALLERTAANLFRGMCDGN